MTLQEVEFERRPANEQARMPPFRLPHLVERRASKHLGPGRQARPLVFLPFARSVRRSSTRSRSFRAFVIARRNIAEIDRFHKAAVPRQPTQFLDP